ncbi:42152_t:CDS:1, partial [Gigaspora margarita]
MELKMFLKDIDIEIPFDQLPEVNEEEIPVMDLRPEKLSSYEIQ